MRCSIGTGATLGLLLLVSTVAYAQSSATQSEHEAHHPPASDPSTAVSSQGMGMMGGPGMMGSQSMMGGQGMMGGIPMMAMPMCAGMTGGFQDPKTAATMLRMHAEMMRSNAEMMKSDAAIMEKYAKQLESQK